MVGPLPPWPELLEGEVQRHPGAGDGGGSCPTIRLNDVTVYPNRLLS